MDKKRFDYIITAAIFILTTAIGGIFINITSHGYIESAIIYLAGILAAGMFWIGREK